VLTGCLEQGNSPEKTLTAFINSVESDQKNGRISDQTANTLIVAASTAAP
jgi:hypothetical protein